MDKSNPLEQIKEDVEKNYKKRMSELDEKLPFMKAISKREKSVFVLLAIADNLLQMGERDSYKYLSKIIDKAMRAYVDKPLLDQRFKKVESAMIGALEHTRETAPEFGMENSVAPLFGAFLASFVSESIEDSSLPLSELKTALDDVASIHLIFSKMECF